VVQTDDRGGSRSLIHVRRAHSSGVWRICHVEAFDPGCVGLLDHLPAVIRSVAQARERLLAAGVRASLVVAVESMARGNRLE
jgi:hypothetical protein